MSYQNNGNKAKKPRFLPLRFPDEALGNGEQEQAEDKVKNLSDFFGGYHELQLCHLIT